MPVAVWFCNGLTFSSDTIFRTGRVLDRGRNQLLDHDQAELPLLDSTRTIIPSCLLRLGSPRRG